MVDLTVISLLSMLAPPEHIQNKYDNFQCQGPLPLYLREPHSLTENHHQFTRITRITNNSYPLIDNIEFLSIWTDPSSQTGYNSLRVPSLRLNEEKPYRRNWRYIPTDYSGYIQGKQKEESFEVGEAMFKEMLELEETLLKLNLTIPPGTSAYLHQHLFRRSHPIAEAHSVLGSILDYTTYDLIEKLIENSFPFNVTPVDLQLLGPVTSCLVKKASLDMLPCDASARYRTINGTCNNILNPKWGSAFSPLRRLVPPNYGDGVKSLRLAEDNKPLPSARLVSTTINSQKSNATCFSFIHLTFGQFLDHDITSTPVVKGEEESVIPCCTDEVKKNPKLLHPECAPISIPRNDPFYSAYGQTCMEFMRSLPSERCLLGPREQVNQITAFIDGSNVYGSTDEDNKKLREGKDGRMLTQVGKNGENLLPPSLDPEDGCNTEEKIKQREFCFIAGDDRVNEQVLLTLMHTIWVREHNRVAGQLQALNPTWSDNRLFQEARRIVVAELQHIVFNEFLTGVLGREMAKKMNFLPQKDGRMTNLYDPDVSPSIANEFATAAYRFGHSMLPGNVQEMSKDGKKNAMELSEVLFKPFFLYSANSTARLSRGGEFQNVLKVDPLFTGQVTGKLFRENRQFGLDLVALNLQRGRDHGIGSYLTLREACGLEPVKTFSHLKQHLVPGALERLQKVYRSVEDIDLFAGGVSEIAIEGGQVGPTFACILADQFLRLKIGDRFWYEEDGPGAFTRDQLRELQRVSLAQVLCQNVGGLKVISRWPMQVPSAFNPQLPCDSPCIPSINFDFWRADKYAGGI